MKNKGFSLVELIVVIAIMAILVGVAVPVYSSYIEKTQKAKDEQMIDEIKHALEIASAGQAFEIGEGGYIILSTSGVTGVEADSNLDKVLKQTFGNDYASTLKLSYGKWENSGLADGLVGLMAYAVNNSSYMTGNRVDALLGDVEKMTGMAQHLVTSLGSNSIVAGTTLSTLFGEEVLNATGAKYGIDCEDWTASDWDAWGAQEENKVAYGNLLVLAAADDLENNLTTGEYSSASGLILEFSSYYAFAATNPSFSQVLDQKLEELQNVSDVSSGKAWYDSLEAAANAAGYDNYRYEKNEDGSYVLEDGEKVISQQCQMDTAAFGSMMAGLGNPSDAQAGILAGDLNNANMFTSGSGNDMYNSYMDAVAATSSIFDPSDMEGMEVPAGSIAILMTYTAEGLVIFTTLPQA